MGKRKSKKGPVSTRVVGGKVQLSASRQAMLDILGDDSVGKAKLIASWEASALKSAAKNQEFQARRTKYGLVVSDDGKYVYVNGNGGRKGAVFSKAGALALLNDLENFRSLVNGLAE